ncbi:hypothetical protein [Citrobacter amalonaticus]|uniref:hypothetical protein n=1 Tax=Citrobacter amalonaticus TaxID=35703 RepID=UPI00300D9E0C
MQISPTTFWAVKSDDSVARFTSQTRAWHDDDYQECFQQSGFHCVLRIADEEWPVRDTFAGKLFALIASR